MAVNLCKYSYKKRPAIPATTPNKPGSSPANVSQNPADPSLTEATMTAAEIKSDILSSLREDLSKIIREELRTALADDFNALKSELQAVRSEITNSTYAIRSEMDRMRGDIKDMEGVLSTWSDEVTSLQTAITSLRSQVGKLTEKNEDLEGRMRRGNVRIVGVDEQPDSSSPTAVSKLLKEVLQMDRDIKIDRSHRSLGQWKPGDRPRVIIAKLHYDGDAVEILRRARDKAPLTYNGMRISIFPDYTTSVAKARAATRATRSPLRSPLPCQTADLIQE